MCKSIFSVFSYTMIQKGRKEGRADLLKGYHASAVRIKIIQIVYFNHSVTKLEINNKIKVRELTIFKYK